MVQTLETLETLASKPFSDSSNGTGIFLVTASRERIPIEPGLTDLSNLINGHQPQAPVQAYEAAYDGSPYFVFGQQREQRHSAEVERGLRHRNWELKHLHGIGHHFGGYHPGKNSRQSPSLRHMGEQLSSVVSAAELFGVPYRELDSVQAIFEQLEEQRRLEEQFNCAARAAQRTYGNGR